MLFERGIKIDHSTIQRWVVKYSQSLLAAFRKHKQAIGKRWKLDETYVKVKGQWVYLYRAVDKAGHTVDFLLTPNRDEEAARTFFDQAVAHNGQPELVNIDKSGDNKAAIAHYNRDHKSFKTFQFIEIRQVKYLNNLIEQDHQFIKRKIRTMMGFKSVHSAQRTLMGIELMHMIKKGQMHNPKGLTPGPLPK